MTSMTIFPFETEIEIFHFVSEAACLALCKEFPNDTWPRVMLIWSLSDEQLKAIEEEQERKNIARIAQQTLHGYQIRHG